MIEPGAVFEIPADLARPPQTAKQAAPPSRENRWVIVVSSKTDCRDRYQAAVTIVLCSAQTEYAGRHDVMVREHDGGMARTSIAQTDLVFVVLKEELSDERHRGTILRDTLIQVRARLADSLGFSGPGT